MANEGLGWDSLLKMVHIPGGDWNPVGGSSKVFPFLCQVEMKERKLSWVFHDLKRCKWRLCWALVPCHPVEVHPKGSQANLSSFCTPKNEYFEKRMVPSCNL